LWTPHCGDSTNAHRCRAQEASTLEVETRLFLRKGGGSHTGTEHPAQLLDDLANENANTKTVPRNWTSKKLPASVKEEEEKKLSGVVRVADRTTGIAG